MSDQAIELKDLLPPSVMSIAAAYQLANFAREVGKARGKFKIKPPATDGDEGFIRVFRAQQNCLEFVPLFFPHLWISSLFFHPVPSVVASLGYLYARHQYFYGYSKNADDRVAPFKLSVKFIQILTIMSAAGVANFALKNYLGYDIPGRITEYISQLRS